MKTHARDLWVLLVIGLLSALVPCTDLFAETIERTVKGKVVATNVTADPNTIVIRVSLPNKEELIVGARVPPDTHITRGTQAVSLADVKVGESAKVTYVKSSDGLATKAIHLR